MVSIHCHMLLSFAALEQVMLTMNLFRLISLYSCKFWFCFTFERTYSSFIRMTQISAVSTKSVESYFQDGLNLLWREWSLVLASLQWYCILSQLAWLFFLVISVTSRWCYPKRIWDQSKAKAKNWIRGKFSVVASHSISLSICNFEYYCLSPVFVVTSTVCFSWRYNVLHV